MALTVGCWVKGVSQNSKSFIDKILYTQGNAGYAIGTDASGKILAFNASYDIAVSTIALSDNWQFVVATKDASNNWILYIDGTQAATGARVVTDSHRSFAIGAQVGGTRFFLGSIAHAFICSAALDGPSIRRLYEIGRRAHTG